MKSFKNNSTGVTLTPKNEWAREQLANDKRFVEVEAKTKAKANKSNTKKAIKDMNKKELVALLNEKGIDANEEMKKDELLALIPKK